MDKQVIKTLPDGRLLYNFDPADEYPDSERVNEGIRVVQPVKGVSLENAQKKAMEREETIAQRYSYQEFVPCVACCSCVIIRQREHGEYKNSVYACKNMKRAVARYGTCTYASTGKTGPLVIERDLTMEEIEANKMNLVN